VVNVMMFVVTPIVAVSIIMRSFYISDLKGATTLSITVFSLTTLRIKSVFVKLSIIILCHYAVCRYADCRVANPSPYPLCAYSMVILSLLATVC
jgi:hypothetical protein